MEKDILNIDSLESLKEYMSNFKGCELHKSATNMVFSDGNPSAKIMLIGEAPGHDEDIQGKPFVGRSGKLLDKMLEAIDLNREKVYIANIVPWRPPNNRRPTDEEIEICLPMIKKHIEIVNPKAILLLGSTATYALIKNNDKRPRTNRTSERLIITETDEETIFRFSVLFFLLFIMFAKI